MSDFGANIFDDEPAARPAPPPRAAPEPEPPPSGTPPPRAPVAAESPPPAPPPPPPAAAEPQPERADDPNPWARSERDAKQKAQRGDASRHPPRSDARRGPARGSPPAQSGGAPGRGPDRHTVFRRATQHDRGEDRAPQRTAPQQAGAQPPAPQPGGGAQRTGAASPRPPAPAPAAVRGVAVLIDLDALQNEARAQRGELSLQRLRAVLGGDRPVQHAIAFAAGITTAPIGFELLAASADPGLAPGVRFAAAAIELLARAGSLVLAPASPWNRQLAIALRAAGHTVDLAGFDAAAAAGERIRVLGRDCLFVP